MAPSLRVPVGDGLVLDAVDTGPADGPVVLLLHGFPQSSWCWRRVWPAVTAAGLRVVAPDQRGYSPDARPADVRRYRMAALVSDAVAVLDAAGAERAHVVGHDWGAAVAWQLAGRHPERVRTLTAVSVPHPAAFVDALRTDPDQRARSRYMKDWQDPTTEAALLAGGLAAVLATARTPTTACSGWPSRGRSPPRWPGTARSPPRTSTASARSPRRPARVVRRRPRARRGRDARTAQHVAGPYRLEVLAGVGHWVPEQAADRLAALLLGHLLEGRDG
jgi:pimeloyl-ACP methyl ester carboxylesterase